MWYIEIWPRKGPVVREVLQLNDREALELGRKISDMMTRKLVQDFTVERWTPLPISEFGTRVLERIEAGTFD